MSEDQVLDESKEFNVVDLPSVDKVPVKSSLRWLFCCMTQEKDELADSYHGPGENLRCQVHESKRRCIWKNHMMLFLMFLTFPTRCWRSTAKGVSFWGCRAGANEWQRYLKGRMSVWGVWVYECISVRVYEWVNSNISFAVPIPSVLKPVFVCGDT